MENSFGLLSCDTLVACHRLDQGNTKPRGHHQKSRSPATRRIYTRLRTASFPQEHGLTQTHFPSQPHKAAWHSNITVHHRLDTTMYHQASWTPPIILLPSDAPNLHQHALLPPMARTHANALSTEATQNWIAQRHHRRNLATQCATDYRYNNAAPSIVDTSNHAEFTPARFPWHGLTQTDLTA